MSRTKKLNEVLQIVVTAGEREQVKRLADLEGMTVSQLVRKWIRNILKLK